MNIIVRVIQNCLVKPEKHPTSSVALKKSSRFFSPVSLCLRPQIVVLHRHEEAWMLLKLSEVNREKNIPNGLPSPTDRL